MSAEAPSSGSTPLNPAVLLDFMREHLLAVEASVSAEGAPQAALVGFVVTDEFELFFDTVAASRKVVNLRRDPRIAFVIAATTVRDERTVQYEGVADEPTGKELEGLKELYFESFPDGRQRQVRVAVPLGERKRRWVESVTATPWTSTSCGSLRFHADHSARRS